jgi:putative Ig domain-containing protein
LRRLATTFCLLGIGLTSIVTQTAHATAIPLTLTNTRDLSLSSWLNNPSPDPMGLSYDSSRNRLLITDSEIEEFNAPYWHGKNFFEVKLTGSFDRGVNISTHGDTISQPNPYGFTDEPADVAFALNPFGAADGNQNHYFISDDNSSRIYDQPLGSDGKFDPTVDITRTFFKTHNMGQDAEGLSFGMVGGEPNLFISMGEGPPANGPTYFEDGSNVHEIYRVRPGPNGRFDGPFGTANPLGDDIVTHFDTCNPTSAASITPTNPCTNPINQPDPEDVTYDGTTGHLFFTSHHINNTGGHHIVSETSLDGTLMNTYDLGVIAGMDASGIVIAPASGDPTNHRSMYIASRGVDNDSQPLANDGKIFEFQLAGPINHAPTVTNPGSHSSNEGVAITPLQIIASDQDTGDTLSFTETGLPPGLTMSATGLITGTTPYGQWGLSNPSVTVTDSLGVSTSVSFPWTVIRDLTPPATPGPLTIGRQTTGISLDWPENTESDLAGYKITRATSSSPSTYTDLTMLPAGTSVFFDETAPPGLTSFYKVTAFDHAVPPNASTVPRTGSARRSKIVLIGSAKAAASSLLLAIPKPDGVAPGDVLVAGVAARDAVAIVPPLGWTLSVQTPRVTSLSQQAVYTHTVAADDPAAYTFIAIGRSAAVGVITAYRGAVERPSKVGGQANVVSDEITAPSLTPTANDSVQIGFFGLDNEAFITAPVGMIIRDEHTMIVDPLGLSLAIADAVVDALPVGARVALASVAAENVGQVVVLSPAP